MKYCLPRISLLAACLLVCICTGPGLGAINTIPAGGTLFIGEQGLDLTAAGVISGSQIGWFGPNGKLSNPPAVTVTVADATDFYASPVTFTGKTGAWYTLPAKDLAFYIEDPTLSVRVYDDTANFEISPVANWVPAGDTVGFRIDSNLYVMAYRPGVSGAPVTIHLRGPDGIEYSSVGGYPLTNIPVSTSPYSTGGVWNTGGSEFARGNYTVWAECNANAMKDNYPVTGKTISEPVTFLMQTVNPLITKPVVQFPPLTFNITEVPTPVQTSVPVTVTANTTPEPETSLPTTPVTSAPTATPGFSAAIGLCSLCATVLLILARRP